MDKALIFNLIFTQTDKRLCKFTKRKCKFVLQFVLESNKPRPNWGSGELVNTFAKIKCLRRLTVLIQSALCSPDLGECFTYPKHVPKSYQIFSRGL